jgi:hypothetical protein
VLLVRHVPFEVATDEVEKGGRGRRLPGAPAQPEGVNQRVVVIAGQRYEGRRAIKAVAAHVPV